MDQNQQCVDIDECQNSNGGCHKNADCTNSIGGRSCVCKQGYNGDGITCKDENINSGEINYTKIFENLKFKYDAVLINILAPLGIFRVSGTTEYYGPTWKVSSNYFDQDYRRVSGTEKTSIFENLSFSNHDPSKMVQITFGPIPNLNGVDGWRMTTNNPLDTTQKGTVRFYTTENVNHPKRPGI